METSENPSWGYSYLLNPHKTKHVCIHGVSILLNKAGLKENIAILAVVLFQTWTGRHIRTGR